MDENPDPEVAVADTVTAVEQVVEPQADVASALELERERLRIEADARIREAVELARAEERERLEAERKAEFERIEKERREAEMSEVERLEAQHLEAQRIAEEAKVEVAAKDAAKLEAEKRAETLERQLAFARALAETGTSLARDATGKVDAALESLAFAEADRMRESTGDLATALKDLITVKPWMFQREKPPAQSNGGDNRPPARRVDPSTPPDVTPVFKQTDEEYARTRRRLGIVH